MSEEKDRQFELMDAASIIVLVSAALYFWGVIYVVSRLSVLGVSASLATYDVYSGITTGFIAAVSGLIYKPFYSIPIIILYALSFKDVKRMYGVAGIWITTLIFVFMYAASVYQWGEQSAKNTNAEIEEYHKDKKTELSATKKVQVEYLSGSESAIILQGLSLGSVGDYYLLVEKKGVQAISKSRIIKIIYAK